LSFPPSSNKPSDAKVVESLGGNLLQDRAAQGLEDFLIVFNLALSKVQDAQDSRAETAKLREELALQAKAFSNRETAMYQELASLRQFEKEVKRLIFEKSQEALQLESKIFPLCC